MKKRRTIKWGYSLIILSLAFVVASGLMFYFYQNNQAPVTSEGNVAGKVKAADGDQWESTWTPGYVDLSTKLTSYKVPWGVDQELKKRMDWIYANCQNSNNWNDGCDKYIKSTRSYNISSSHANGWLIDGLPPVQNSWKVAGDVNNKSFTETWNADRFLGPKTYYVTKTDDVSHHGILFTGRARIQNNKLQFQTYRGTEHTVGADKSFLNYQAWLPYGHVPSTWGINPDTGNKINISSTHSFKRLKQALVGEAAMGNFSYGVYHHVASSMVPESWTITGCFTDTGSCN
jgi:hypothetical protein